MTGDDRPNSRRTADRLAQEARDREIADLKDTVGQLAASLRQVAARGGGRPEPVPAIRWHDLAPAEYAEMLDELRAWMRTVLFDRFPADAEPILPCWASHPAAVEALTVGWQTWTTAWSEQAEPETRARWLGMWRPNMREQVARELASCKAGHPTQYPPDPRVIDGLAADSGDAEEQNNQREGPVTTDGV